MLDEILTAVAATAAASATYLVAAARVVKQYERGVVFRLGRLHGEVRPPGFTLVVPGVDRLHKVNLQIITMPVPAQEGITRDNVTVRVDAVVYFKVVDAPAAIVNVEDYRFAVSQMAQTSLRSIIGKSDLDDLLSNREKLNQGLELMIDSPAIGWGVQIDRVEIKDVSLPDTMKRSMARQAEADRERRARVINADAEFQASKKLAEAAQQMSDTPRPSSSACCRPSSRSPPRRTPPSCSPSRSNSSASWSGPPSSRTTPWNPASSPTARDTSDTRGSRDPHQVIDTAGSQFLSASRKVSPCQKPGPPPAPPRHDVNCSPGPAPSAPASPSPAPSPNSSPAPPPRGTSATPVTVP
ncbi:hypothetical protein SHKM778_29180 [Streptomyces sp. KM77-8]|uniref:Band 7 domain-containing protein n=1 Tax=Streptomyces haneummycinicus TaxID=3074435 RepID=A0AAT9HGA9_9ACTN